MIKDSARVRISSLEVCAIIPAGHRRDRTTITITTEIQGTSHLAFLPRPAPPLPAM
jgi:hypothetical protein